MMIIMKAKKTNDHYVSQTYLRRFLTPGKNTLFAYYKDKDGFFEPTTGVICASKGWDNLDADGTVPPFLKRQQLALETHLSSCLDMLTVQPLLDTDRFALSLWLATVFSISPHSLTHMGEFLKAMGELTTEIIMKRPSKNISEEDIRFYNEHKEEIELSVNKYYPKQLAMTTLYSIALGIYMANWRVSTNKTSWKFLTCDKPFHFICWNDNPQNLFNPKGIAIDPEHYLMVEPLPVELHEQIKNNKDKDYTYFQAGKTTYDCFEVLNRHNMNAIRFINQHTVYNADRFIISAHHSKNIADFVRHNRKFSTDKVLERIDLDDKHHIIMGRLKNNFPNLNPRRKNKKPRK